MSMKEITTPKISYVEESLLYSGHLLKTSKKKVLNTPSSSTLLALVTKQHEIDPKSSNFQLF